MEVKNVKRHKGRVPIPIGGSTKGTTLAYGEWGIRIKGNGARLTAKQLTTAREVILKKLKILKGSKVYLRVFPDIPVCIKGNETRMGKGKGTFEYWATRAPIGRVIFEIGGVPIREELARDILRQAAAKLPTKMEFINKNTPPRLGYLLLTPPKSDASAALSSEDLALRCGEGFFLTASQALQQTAALYNAILGFFLLGYIHAPVQLQSRRSNAAQGIQHQHAAPQVSLLKSTQRRKTDASVLHRKWEEVDHDEFDVSVENSLLYGGASEREGDYLGLGSDLRIKDLDDKTKPHISITSKTFDPSTYITVVYPNATYPDLSKGVSHLQNAIDARAAALRGLVDDNFDRFVTVKASTYGVYEDMKQEVLAPETDFSTRPLREHLKYSVQKSNQIFLPILEASSKAQKIQTTHTIFERSKFFFNLPSFIMESIDAGRYELALRDYKKGKFLLENRPGQLLPSGSSKDPRGSAAAQEQQTRILQKVWNNVEKAMGELTKVLIKQLQDPSRSIEDNEKALETLIELQSNDEAVWTYFDSHHKLIMDKTKALFKASLKSAEGALEVGLDAGPALREERGLQKLESEYDDHMLIAQLQAAILHLELKQSDAAIAKSPAEPEWIAALNIVKTVSDLVSTSLTNFWRVAKHFIDGKYSGKGSISLRRSSSASSSGPGSRRSFSQCRAMAFDIVKLYISMVSQIFVLSDMLLMAKASGAKYKPPPLLPGDSHSMCTAYYLKKIMNEVLDCVSDINALDISADMKNGLKSLMESMKWRFEDVLTHEWVRDATVFNNLESWAPSRDSSSSTHYLTQFEVYQRYMATAAYRIVSPDESGGGSPKQVAIPQVFSSMIIKAFVDSLYAFMDGLVYLASADAPLVHASLPETAKAVADVNLQQIIDLRDPSSRLLLVISNLDHFSTRYMPGMATQLENAFGLSLKNERTALNNMVDDLAKQLFNTFFKPRAEVIRMKIKNAVPDDEMDWYNAPLPQSIRPYVYSVLDYLVEIHAQVCSVSSALLGHVMRALVEDLALAAKEAFQQVGSFGTGGLLQAVMELTFIHKSLGIYAKESSGGKVLEELYTRQLTQRYNPTIEEDEFQRAFEGMQRVLNSARKRTGVHFLCFRNITEREKEKETRPKKEDALFAESAANPSAR
ncbi:hypothetical protein D9619_010689 [Psilocybe cf. subviscida]|uniref:Exocyst complex component SEC5 n=1 Tax=Psilocybe cf. subviscida TaxID=2480587 RepID=A0A8H5B869_9AGAR|nr:hypothetical protein D9619_010689 [Psilocybe cf. subviscida]